MSPQPRPVAKDIHRVPVLSLADIRALIDPIRQDAREARDGVIKLTAAFAAQDTNASITALTISMREQHNALRQDVVLAIGNVRTDLKDVDVRVEDLETEQDKKAGGSALIRAFRDNIAWLVALAASAFAFLDHRHK